MYVDIIGYFIVAMIVAAAFFAIIGFVERTIFLNRIRELTISEMRRLGYAEDEIFLSPKYIELQYNLRVEEDLTKYENGNEIETAGTKSARFILIAVVLGMFSVVGLFVLHAF